MPKRFCMAFALFAVMNLPVPPVYSKVQLQGNDLSVQEFRGFAESLPKLPGQIQAVRLFRESGGREASVAVATWGERSGWQLFVFSPHNGQHFQLEWKSGKLDDSFYVSYPDALKIFNFGEEDGVEFSGCARHVCPEVFSIMIYVPSRQVAFKAKSIYGRVLYSPSLETPRNHLYKDALDQLIKERQNQ
ncbi:MAG: hypothetical protein ACRD28_02975 [Acidobacteriaceae bacterium]